MRLLKREALLWEKRYILWALLIILILAGHLGHLGYPYYETWHNHWRLLNDIRFEEPAAEYAAHSLLWKSMAVHMTGNVMNVITVVLLLGASLGLDLHRRKTEGMCFCEIKPETLFIRSFGITFLLSLILTIIPMFFVIQRMKDLFAGCFLAKDVLFFVKPLLRHIMDLLLYISLSMLACVLFSRRHYLQGIAMSFVFCGAVSILQHLAATAIARGIAGPGMNRNPLAYYFVGVDTSILDRQYVLHTGNEAAMRIYGNTLFLLDAVLICLLLIAGGVLFVKMQKKHLLVNQQPISDLQDMVKRNAAQQRKKNSKEGKVYYIIDKSLPEATPVAGQLPGQGIGILQRRKGESAHEAARQQERGEKCLYDARLDIWDNLKLIQLQRSGIEAAAVEQVIQQVGLDGQNERRKELRVYAPNMLLCYELAAMQLSGAGVLIPDTTVDGTDLEGRGIISNAVLHLSQAGADVFLKGRNAEDVYSVVDYFLIYKNGSMSRMIAKEQIEAEADVRISLQTDDRKRTEQVLNNLLPEEYEYQEDKDTYFLFSHTIEEELLKEKLASVGVKVRMLERTGHSVQEILKKYD